MIITITSTFDKRMSNYYFEYQKLKVADFTGCLYTFPVFIFSFTTQINLLQCFQELEKPTLRRMHKVLAKQHFVCFTIYMFIGIFGYLSFPTDDGGASASFIQRYNPIENFPILVVDHLSQIRPSCCSSSSFSLHSPSTLCRPRSPSSFCCAVAARSSHLYGYTCCSLLVSESLNAGLHVAVTFCACVCIIKQINMDKIIGYFSAATSTFVGLSDRRLLTYFRLGSS